MRFEFGKGKKKTAWEIEQFGRVLRAHESPGGSPRLPGFRTFSDERAARIELERLVSERLEKGFVPADDPAREHASAMTRPAAAAPVAPTLPLRRDLYIYNEATGFMVTSMALAGVKLDEGSKKWKKAVADGRMIPVTLFQDDPFVVRVVAGEPLTAQETEEWVGRIEWTLDIPDGKLAITGGAVLVNEEYDPEDPYFESYIGIVGVPAGRYRVTIYTYVPGVNGDGVLSHVAGGDRKRERYGKWFRRTRPGEPFPPWLVDWCICDPSADPDHREEWKSAKRPDESKMPEYVNFLVHLERSAEAEPAGKPPGEDGWFGEAEGARPLERCPLGVEAHHVIGHKEEGEGGGWIYMQETHQNANRFPTAAIEGGPVEVNAEDLCNVYRLAWFSHGLSVPEIRATLPSAKGFTPPAEQPAESIVLLGDRVLRIGFSNDVTPVALISLLAKMAPFFAALPEGTELELACSQTDPQSLDAKVPIGLHRYRGHILGGHWRIEETFPKVTATTLRAALALSAELADGEGIAMKDPAEAEAIMKWAKGNHGVWIEDNPGKIEDGRLTLGKREPNVLALYGKAAFAVRFRETWPVLDLSGDEEEEEEIDLSMPVQGKKILETPGGRMYFATMALMVSEKIAAVIQKEERALQQLGFKHVGDLVCNLFSKIAVRGYAMDGGDTWACFLVAAPDTLVFEMSTRFEKDGASLLTTRKPGARDDAPNHTYRQSVLGGDYAAMWERHNARKTELMARCGAPVKIERTHASLADAIEAALKKQLGG